jgi:hypothetical protein
MARPKGRKTTSPNAKTPGGVGRSATTGERDRARIQELDLMGWSQARIADAIGRSKALVNYELKTIRKQYHDAYVDDRKAMVMKESAVLMRVRAEAFEELDKLKRDGRRKRVRQTGEGQKGAWSKNSEVHEDAAVTDCLNTIFQTERQIAELWGLADLPKVVFNIDARAGSQPVLPTRSRLDC